MMTREWGAEFTPAVVIDEMEQAHAEWQTAKEATAEFIADFRSQEIKRGKR